MTTYNGRIRRRTSEAEPVGGVKLFCSTAPAMGFGIRAKEFRADEGRRIEDTLVRER